MAISVAAVKAAVAILSDEKARTAVLAVVVGALVAVVLPIVMVVALLTAPLSELTAQVSDDELAVLTEIRAEYGLVEEEQEANVDE